jgi:TetR/AcrR family transcriptional repressor of nem operon
MHTDTRSTLIGNATALVRRQGYAAFSYADLAEAVGIRKPSIHHHFPTKEDLGAAMVEAYGRDFAERLDAIAAETGDPLERLGRYAGLYREGLALGQGCLCGVLASEAAVLPPRVRAEVERFFAANLRWLERVLRDGQASAALRGDLEPSRGARTVLSALQGAMFVALSLGTPETFDDAVAGLRTILGSPG